MPKFAKAKAVPRTLPWTVKLFSKDASSRSCCHGNNNMHHIHPVPSPFPASRFAVSRETMPRRVLSFWAHNPPPLLIFKKLNINTVIAEI